MNMEKFLPYENGRMNWWALAALITPVFTLLLGFLLSNWVSSKDKLFENMISQNTAAIKQHVVDTREMVIELKQMNEGQNTRLRSLEDSVQALYWVVQVPDKKRMYFQPPPSMFPLPKADDGGTKK